MQRMPNRIRAAQLIVSNTDSKHIDVHGSDGWGKPVPVPAFRGMYDWGNVAYDETRKMYALAIKQHVSGKHRHPVLGTRYGRRWFMTTSRDTKNWTPLVDMTGVANFNETMSDGT